MTFEISRKALEWLRGLLADGKWKKCEKTQEALKKQHRSCVLLFEVWPEVEVKEFDLQSSGGREAAVKYADEKLTIEIPEKDLTMIDECFAFYAKEGLPSTKHIFELHKIFGKYEV